MTQYIRIFAMNFLQQDIAVLYYFFDTKRGSFFAFKKGLCFI